MSGKDIVNSELYADIVDFDARLVLLTSLGIVLQMGLEKECSRVLFFNCWMFGNEPTQELTNGE